MKKKVALVLSTGGARGLAHIGVIEELEKFGYEISSITGSSIGALVGAAYVTGKLKEFKEIAYNMTLMTLLKYIDISFSSKGLIKGDNIMKLISQIIPETNIEDLPIPFTAIATNILNDQEVIFNKGSLYDAIRASISLPFIFTPVKYNNMLLMDGGILNPLPLSHIRPNKDELVIAVVSCAPKTTNSFQNYNLISETITTMIQKMIQTSIDKYKPDIVIRIPVREFGILQFNKAKKIINIGNLETKKLLHSGFSNI